MKSLDKRKIAILATDGFEESELREPKKALEDDGAEVHIVSDHDGKIKSWSNGEWSQEYDVDYTVESIKPDKYDALVLPGGLMNPDKLRDNNKAVLFVRSFFEEHKPVSAICHGPWLLAEADVLNDRRVTSYSSIKTDLKNAGAKWEDKAVVTDQGLVTSRSPEDLTAFIDKMKEEIREGRHAHQVA